MSRWLIAIWFLAGLVLAVGAIRAALTGMDVWVAVALGAGALAALLGSAVQWRSPAQGSTERDAA